MRRNPSPDTLFEIAGVILAGGRARRMGGGDKGLRLLGDRPLLAHVIDRLRPQVARLALNANGDPARFPALGLPVLPDAPPVDAGPLAGVLAGMDWAAGQGFAFVVTAACDTPFFPATLAADLATARTALGAPIAVAATCDEGGHTTPHPTFGLWSTALRDDLRAALDAGLRRMQDWTARHPCAHAIYPNAGAPFLNVNTPDDLAAAEALLPARVP